MQFDITEEKQILELCRKDISHFSKLYEKYHQPLYSYCVKRCNGDKDKAFDIASDTFTKAIENINKYKFTGRPFIAWLYTISHNLIIDSYRNKSYLSIEELEVEPREETDEVIDKLAEDELQTRLKEVVKVLPLELQTIIQLKNDQDLTFAQIAESVSKSEASVKMQYYRGLDLIKRKLSDFSSKTAQTVKILLCFLFKI